MSMKLLSPLDSIEEVDGLARAGAGEFFCGVLEDRWHEKYPVISINRRPAGKGHFRRFADLKEAVARSHGLGIPVYFTVNEHYYTQAQYDLVRWYLDSAADARVDAFIITDFGLRNATPRYSGGVSEILDWIAFTGEACVDGRADRP